ncbi:hypothetical protein OSB04_003699 [Centaurea solstitialis]|uniref:Reverse transcriptase domain-containing protein n=1 Tax=Centaurea solstitialis TaxID=347529 RepID=A0AA38TVD9_9ASTR|nr:hypothetical protein OSB04_003699 [Centaurea solstitialis]
MAGEKDSILKSLKDQVSSLDLKAESSGLSAAESHSPLALELKILDLEKSAKLDLKQRCRLKWAISGDENSKLFHRVINNNRRRNFIHGISVNGVWATDPSVIKEAALDYFSKKFECNSVNRPMFRSNKFKVLSGSQRVFLEDNISETEVKNVIWDCGGDKVPGPDGYTLEFLKSFWPVIKEDLLKAVRHFESSASIDPGCNPSFITLIPKVTSPLSFAEFRPISLIGCFYKVLAKVLSNRLKAVIDSIIGYEQTAFIANRNILDGALIISEIISWAKASKRKTMILKVDFEKAFDSLSWDVLDDIQDQMGFGLKWRSWIQGCLKSASMSVLINGSPTPEFHPKKGVREGDPFAPFLFIIAAEGLNIAMHEAKEKGVFHGTKLPNNGSILSNLHYADDAIFVGEWSTSNARNLARILRCFYLSSALKVNFQKSSIVGIGVNDTEISLLANLLNCKVGSLPMNYLGLPIGVRMNKAEFWGPVINKFLNKLSSWKASLLSFGGRLTLCKSAPVKILKKLETIRSKFFWGMKDSEKKITWIAWTKVIAPKDSGGLGIGSLKAQNLALLSKWWWRFWSENQSLWKMVIQSFHGTDGGLFNSRKAGKFPGVWRNILKIQDGMKEANLCLESLFQFPSLSALRDAKDCSWALDPSGRFSVSSIRWALDDMCYKNQLGAGFMWLKTIPSKINILAWRIFQKRILYGLGRKPKSNKEPFHQFARSGDRHRGFLRNEFGCIWIELKSVLADFRTIFGSVGVFRIGNHVFRIGNHVLPNRKSQFPNREICDVFWGVLLRYAFPELETYVFRIGKWASLVVMLNSELVIFRIGNWCFPNRKLEPKGRLPLDPQGRLPLTPSANRGSLGLKLLWLLYLLGFGVLQIPTRVNLLARGVSMDIVACPLCGGRFESEEHLFWLCPFSKSVIRDICKWWHLESTSLGGFTDIFSWINSLQLPSRALSSIMAVIYVFFWVIWQLRNHLIFSPHLAADRSYIPVRIQALSFNWIKNRSKSGWTFNWVDWCTNPVDAR